MSGSGWNRGTDAAKPASQKKPGIMRGAIAGLAVVAILGVAAFFIFGGKDAQPKAGKVERKPAQIAEVKPANPSVEEENKEPQTKEEFLAQTREISARKKAERARKPQSNKRPFGWAGGNHPPPKRLFDTFPENYLAGLLRGKVGGPKVGFKLPKDFDEVFKAHIADPIRYADDDTPEDRALRERVHEVKKEMAKMIGDGQTPSQIILAERNELKRIEHLRRDMLRSLCDLKKNGASKEDVDIYVQAANIKLSEYGAAHIKLPSIALDVKLSAESSTPMEEVE